MSIERYRDLECLSFAYDLTSLLSHVKSISWVVGLETTLSEMIEKIPVMAGSKRCRSPVVYACVLSHSVVSYSLRLHGLYSQPDSVHVIFESRILESVAISSTRGSSNPGTEPASPASPALAVDSLSIPPWEVVGHQLEKYNSFLLAFSHEISSNCSTTLNIWSFSFTSNIGTE